MIIVLPSLGILGTKSVDLSPLRFSDIREIQNMSPDPNLVKVELMHRLLPETDFSKITRWDLEYLYNITVFSAVYNTVEFKTSCPDCSESIPSKLCISDMDVKQLPSGSITKRINGTKYTYHHVSAKQYEEALINSQPADDEQSAYEDNIVAAIFGISLDKVRNLPAPVYMSAFLFLQMSFHGVFLAQEIECPKCHRKFRAIVNVPIEVVKVDIPSIMDNFVALSDTITFNDFNNMTIPEYDNFVKSLNDRASR